MKSCFPHNLKSLRKSFGMKQAQLAELLTTSQRNVSYWENGATQPDIDTLIKIADIFDVTLDELVGRKSERK